LRIQVSLNYLRKLASYPAPTYIIGIDEIAEIGYIISVTGKHQKGLTSLSTQFPLNKETQDMLWQEVVNFWESVDFLSRESRFVDLEWR